MKLLSPSLSMGLLSAALLLAASTQATAQEYTFTTLAGPAEAGAGDADGPGSLARFRTPRGAAVDSAGNVYVADGLNHTIRKVSPGGVVTTLAGLAGSAGSADGTGSQARFFYPWAIAVDGTDNVYVADSLNHTIRKVTPGGVVTTLAGLAGSYGSADGTGSNARFTQPEGVAVDSAGNLYVGDTANQTIRKITPGGVVTTLAGLAGSSGSADGTGSDARLYHPNGVAVDNAGNVYVADTGNHTIRKITPGGVVMTLAGLAGSHDSTDGTGSNARFYSPCSVAVDSAGNLYVTDSSNHTIRKVTPGGVVTTLAGVAGSYGGDNGTSGNARFWSPQGVAVDSAGNVYVTDTANRTIRKVTPGGVVTTLAGVAGNSGSADGTGSAAQFDQPHGVAVDGAGNVYMADSCNGTIRKVTPGGVVTTLAGVADSYGSADGTGSAARFSAPDGVAADSAGNVYVADTGNHTIRKITPGGVVTTLAGWAGSRGSADGMGTDARFWSPQGVALDSAGNVYVADFFNHTIRKVTPGGVVTTLAGWAGSSGSANGTGSNARFYHPWGVAVDSAGNVYVAEYLNHTIRKVTPGGVVTTLAGLAIDADGDGYPEGAYADGTGSAARFNFPEGVAVDSAGNVYVADYFNSTIRKVTPGGVVTTVAGVANNISLGGGMRLNLGGNVHGTGGDARFCYPVALAMDSAGNLYVADAANCNIRLGRLACPDAPTIDLATGFVGQARQLDTSPQSALAWHWRLVRIPAGSALASWTANVRNPTFTPDVADLFVFQLTATNAAGQVAIRTLAFNALPVLAPAILSPPLTQTAESGSSACLRVVATNTAPGTTYQWYFNGSALSGATGASLVLTNVQPARGGAYTVVVSNVAGAVTSAPASLAVIAPVQRSKVPAIYLVAGPRSYLHLEYRDALGPDNAWLPLSAFTVTNVPQLCVLLPGPMAAQRFYRAWNTSSPPVRPRLDSRQATQIPLTGPLGSSVRIDYLNAIGPTDAWVTLATVTLTNSPQPYFDLGAFGQAPRLYRLVPLL